MGLGLWDFGWFLGLDSDFGAGERGQAPGVKTPFLLRLHEGQASRLGVPRGNGGGKGKSKGKGQGEGKARAKAKAKREADSLRE